ncbi:MAG: hypothetical protein CMJ58_23210 [Planctomycetaceae bacterium]|nr:hypothetical protein [Planctomycetaceae bacterium]
MLRHMAAAFLIVATTSSARAAITFHGEVGPSDPAAWPSRTEAHVGRSSYGSISVDAGSLLRSNSVGIGYDFGATGMVAVNGVGSQWSSIGISDVFVGKSGNGELNVTDGGAVANYNCWVGTFAGSTGRIVVDGVDSVLVNASGLSLGFQGAAELAITGGGYVRSAIAYSGNQLGSTSQIAVDGDGSFWWIQSDLHLGGQGAATLSITRGGSVEVDGRLNIDAYAQGSSYIAMASGGKLAMRGAASDSLVQFLDLVEGTDAIYYWDNGASQLSTLAGATDGVDYTLEYSPSLQSTILSVVAPGPSGDFNHNFAVTGADFLAWQRGESPVPIAAADLALWHANLGLGVTSTATASATPEASGIVLAVIAIGLSACNRHVPTFLQERSPKLRTSRRIVCCE